ncbi:non-specific serine/threonine protein kinase [Ranunculus cassubicifolius]
MSGEEPEIRKKHHRSSDGDDDASLVEGSKRRKHSHHRKHRHHHHHRHRSSKRDCESNLNEIGPIVDSNLTRFDDNDDDKEEGEILEEDDNNKRKVESDVESGEIKSAETSNLANYEGGENDSVKNQELEVKYAQVLENERVVKAPANGRGSSEYQLGQCSDGKESYDDETRDTVDDKIVETDIGKRRDMKGERRHRDKTSRRAGRDDGHKSRKHGNSESSLDGKKLESRDRDLETSVRTQNGSSGSPLKQKDVNKDFESQKLKKKIEIDAEEFDSVRHVSKNYSESVDMEYNTSRNVRKSISPDIKENTQLTVAPSPYKDRYHEGVHVGKTSRSRDHVRERSRSRDHAKERSPSRDHTRERSRSHDHVRERRSRSRSHFQGDTVYHRESEVKPYTDNGSRVNRSGSREARNESDLHRIVRHDREDRHGSREWMRERERERSSSYSRNIRREDRRESWDTREKDKERDIWEKEREERGRESDKRVRDRDRYRDFDRDRNRDSRRNRQNGREQEDLDLDMYRDSKHSQRSEAGLYDEKNSKHQPKRSDYTNEALEAAKDIHKRDEEEQEDYDEAVEFNLVVEEEEDIDRIKEESRKRREAILEKYRQQQQSKLAVQEEEDLDQIKEKSEKRSQAILDKHKKQQEEEKNEPHSEDSEIEKDSLTIGNPTMVSPEKLVSSTPEAHGSRNNEFGAGPVFAVGKSPSQNGLVPFERDHVAGGLGDGTPQSERSEDMFRDDIFGESPVGVRRTGKGENVRVERNGLNDNWDDAEGYYSYRFGEVLDGRYEVIAAHGKGVFSTVVRAKDLKAGNSEPEEVAIKIIRSNDTMLKAGLDELVILKKLADADPEDRRHCVRFISSFKYRNHLCLVFESLHMNLREVLKKFGRNIGLKLTAVRAYAKQLFIALKHLRNCGVLHCDIKPDNMLVNETKTVLKLCDFGNAMFAGKNEITPYLVSRFYRAPEIILGLTYDHPMDIWSVGCCLYELYSGKVLFPGPSNNDMLRLHMELKGSFPKKMLRKGAFTDQHFDHDMNFLATEEDPVTKKAVKMLLRNIKAKDIGFIITGCPGEDPKMLANFKDLLEKIFVLDPEKRMTVSQALSHPFITGK